MKNKTTNRLLSVLLIVMLVVLAGCQTVSGLDLNKAMQNGAAVKSSQGSQTLTLELVRNASVKPSDELQRMLDLFGNVKLTITDMKQQDISHLSAKGSFEYGKGKIPFHLVMTDQQYIIQVEGAKQPIVIKNTGSMQQMQDTISKEMQEQLRIFQKKVQEFAPSIASYFTGNLPNPKNINVFDSKQMINNETLNMKQVHAEIKGSELTGLIKELLTNLLADETGMKKLLGELYDIVLPLAQQALKESKDNSMEEIIGPYVKNKTLAVEFAFTFLKNNLKKAVDSYDQSVQEMLNSPAGGFAKELLSDNSVLKFDMFVDRELMPRKSSMELVLSNIAKGEEPISGLKITSAQEIWNVNKSVTADAIDLSGGKLELESLNNPAKVLAALNTDSKLYDLLKNDLKIAKKEVHLFMSDDDNHYFIDSLKPYNRDGVIMVPARFVVEELDADVKWDAATSQVTITDSLNGTVIKLNVGSKQGSVNGTIKQLEAEAELTNGTTFVPVRFIAENMGAKVEWDPELQMVTIKRD